MSIGGRASTLLRVVIAASLALVFAAPFAAAGPKGCATEIDLWDRLPAPDFSIGDEEVTSFGVSPVDPNHLVASNGSAIAITRDGGCNWQETFVVPASASGDYPYTRAESRIASVVVSPGSPSVVYATVEQLDAIPRPHAIVSENGGISWRPADSGLEAARGTPLALAPSPSDPRRVYLLTSLEAEIAPGTGYDVAQSLYVSGDAGSSWAPRREFFGGLAAQLPIGTTELEGDTVDGIVVDPLDADTVWLYGRQGLFVSRDGGSTIRKVDDVGSVPIGVVDVMHLPGRPAIVLAYQRDAPVLYLSQDGGQNFASQDVLGIAQSAVHGRYAGEVAVATNLGVYYSTPLGFVLNVSPADGRSMLDLRSALDPRAANSGASGPLGTTVGLALFARGGGTIERHDVEAPQPEDIPPTTVGDLSPVPVNLEDPSLRPAKKRIVLRRGESKTVPYRLVLPRRPTPLDVYFLIDVSGSMQDTIDGVRSAMSEIVGQLTGAGVDAWFGVGQYRSYNDHPAYERVRDIGPANQGLSQALNTLDARGGGEETQLAALLQSSTGGGQNDPNAYIERNQQANFRTGSLRVVIHSTDEGFSTGSSHPTYEQAIAGLNRNDVLQVGLAIQTLVETTTGVNQGPGETSEIPQNGLERVAIGTGALAPEQGVDCNGDQTVDLQPGSPLVCIIDPERSQDASVMAPAIVSLLKAVEDIGAVEVKADVKAEPGLEGDVVSDITPGAFHGIDFKAFHRLTFDVTFTCPRLEEGRRFRVKIEPQSRGRTLAVGEAVVVCHVPAPEDEKERPEGPRFLTGFVPLPPIAPPSARPPDPVPNLNPNPHPNPATNPQAQGSLAAQRRERPQLAYVTAPSRAAPEEVPALERSGEQYAMSKIRRGSEGDPASTPQFVYAAGVMSMAFVFACVTARRRQEQAQRARRW